MAINLATLDVALRSVGGEKVAADLDKVDQKGRKAGKGIDTIAPATGKASKGLTDTGTAAGKAAPELDKAGKGAASAAAGVAKVAPAADTATRAVKGVGKGAREAATDVGKVAPAATTAAKGIKDVGAAGATAATGLGRGARATRDTGAALDTTAAQAGTAAKSVSAVAPASTRAARGLAQTGAAAKKAAVDMAAATKPAASLGTTVARLAATSQGAQVMTRRIRELTAGVQIAGTRAASLERLRLIETQLTAALAQGNLTIQQRVVLERQLTATRAGLASTTQAAAGAERSMSTLGATLRTLGFSIAAFSVARLVGGLFEAATMAEETASKFETTMGQSADSVRAFLAEFGPMAGLSRTVGEEMTATAAAIVQGMGMSQQASARFSRQIIQTAGDLQSFHNVPIEETFRALRAGIVGEYEPLRRLGVVLTEATVKQRALSDSGKEHADQLTQSELATTRLTMAIERMGVANGDLERTQDATQNQARRTRAELENLRIELAQYLSGAFASAVASGAGLVRLLARNGPLIAGMAAATVTIGALTLAVKAYAFATGVSAVTGTTRFIAALTALRVAALNPVVIGVTAVAVAVGGLVTMLLRARQRADEQREAMAALAATTRDSRDALREYQDAQTALDRLPAAASADERRAAYDRQQASIRALMALGPDYQRAIEDEIVKQGDLAAAIQGVTDKRNADLKAAALQADQALMDAVRARENAQAALGRSGAYDTQRVLSAAMEAEAAAVDASAEAWRNYARAIGLLDVPEPEGGTGPEGPDAAELRKIAEARAQELIAAAERERAIQGATHDKARAIDDAAHAEGLRALDTYYGTRRQMLEAEAQKEIAALEVQRSALASLAPEDEAGRIRQRTQLADIENRIAVRQIVLERERAQLAAQEGQARTQLAAKIVDAEREVQAAQGRTREIALASVERQAESYDALLRQQGRSVEERERLVAAYREPLIAKVEFDEAEREAKRVLAEIELARTRIRQQVEQGLISEAEGQRQLAELEKARLPQLEALADAMEAFAAALGNPDLAAAAARFRAELGSIGATAEGLGERMGRAMVSGFAAAWGDGFEALGRDGSLTSGMEAFGNALLSGFGSALQSFGEAVVVASGLMEAVVAAFSSLNPIAMAGAGFALIAIGGMLKGAASRAMGRGGSSARAPVGPVDTTHQVTLGSRSSGNAAQRTAPASGSSAQTAALTTGTVRPVDTASLTKPAPAVNINNPIFASPYDSTWQRNLTATIKQATRNGAL